MIPTHRHVFVRMSQRISKRPLFTYLRDCNTLTEAAHVSEARMDLITRIAIRHIYADATVSVATRSYGLEESAALMTC
jgi:hypothetical protein